MLPARRRFALWLRAAVAPIPTSRSVPPTHTSCSLRSRETWRAPFLSCAVSTSRTRRCNHFPSCLSPASPSRCCARLPGQAVRSRGQRRRPAFRSGRPAHRRGADLSCPGARTQPYGRGLALPQTFGGVQSRPDLPWIGLPADPSADKALVQTLTGRLATYVAHFVATAGASPTEARLRQFSSKVTASPWKSLRASGGEAPGRPA